ncbi:MAG: bifunctional hydroxymethylpyrimidine kinase/phosphomethylpyrimidine kinase [Verrucomicrobia bacterium]|nr:bifunctional hydroxymethylpyrimidine kinase/phosphomethylpyrimidine kinase [Verrucomicrobiota bacterium]
MRNLPIALTIAGSDSGGGAGIQADLKTFAALGTHGTTAVTCLTAQNPKGVSGIQVCPPQMVRAQIRAVFAELPPAAVKTGMLYSAAIIRAVAACLSERSGPPLIVDPVMVATSGARLLQRPAIRALQERLLPMAALATPNLDEAAILAERRVRSVEDLRAAARLIHGRHGCAVLVKGGHLRGLREAVDIFYDGSQELLLSAPFVRGRSTHGTGCTYSAAITAYVARGYSLARAIGQAKEYVSQAIGRSVAVARRQVLGFF